ncbi:MAG: hypothetical protein ACO31D_04365, partial [Ilumatobacteraceae bacterium]
MAKKRAKSAPRRAATKRSAGTKSAKRKSVAKSGKRKTGAPRRRGPRSASDRVAGLLVILPWLMKRKRVRLSTVAQQFRMSEEELVADLQMAAVCGVPP